MSAIFDRKWGDDTKSGKICTGIPGIFFVCGFFKEIFLKKRRLKKLKKIFLRKGFSKKISEKIPKKSSGCISKVKEEL